MRRVQEALLRKGPPSIEEASRHPTAAAGHVVTGSFGAKGAGEPALIPTAPAIVNAIYDALGVRICNLPATPDKTLAALKEKASASSFTEEKK